MIVIELHRIPGKTRDWLLKHVRAGQEVFSREIVSAGFRQVGEEKELGLKEIYSRLSVSVEGRGAGDGRGKAD